MRIGVIGFSWSYRPGEEPNPHNILLGGEVERIVKLENCEGNTVKTVLQWEVASAVKNVSAANVIKIVQRFRKESVNQSDTEEIIDQAIEAFNEAGGVDEVVVVANPFLQLQGARAKCSVRGLKLRKRRIRWIGFDRKSSQWQVRGPVRCIVYTVLRVLNLYAVTTSLPCE